MSVNFIPDMIESGPIKRRQQAIEYDPGVEFTPPSTSASRSPTRSWRWIWPLIYLVPLVVVGRLVQLQVINGNAYRSSAENNRTRIQVIPAPRGSIIDRDGRIMAENQPNFVLMVTPADLPETDAEKENIWSEIAATTGVSVELLQERLRSYQGSIIDQVVLVDRLNADQAFPIMVAADRLPGISIESYPARAYPLGSAAAHLLGYIGPVNSQDLTARPELKITSRIGQSGLERQYDRYLIGQDGQREIERDVYHQRREILYQSQPTTGQTLRLTINAELQQRLADQLSAAVNQAHGTGGAAVVMDPRNGEILALVSVPSYDNNWFVDSTATAAATAALTDDGKPLLNRAIAGQYPSGSIIKPLLGLAGLNTGVVTTKTTVNSTGGIRIGRDYFPDWKSGGHGQTDIYRAIAESVNTYFYYLGGGYENFTGLGVDRMVEYLEQFNWGKLTEIDLQSEAAGLLPTAKWRSEVRSTPWRLGDTYHLSIGQGDLQVTPLQVTTAMAAIANGGTVYQPRLMKEIQDSDGHRVLASAPIVRNIIDAADKYFSAIRQGMRQGVLSGSSRALQSLPVEAAGKTGTAQFGSAGKNHAWFTAFAPYVNPSFVITVIVEAGGEGNAVALPVAQEVMAWYFDPNK